VNILAAQMSQDTSGKAATVMLRLDRDVPADVRTAIGAAVHAVTLDVVDLS
jgi:D-3-phosphoglycerate dehydrogenase